MTQLKVDGNDVRERNGNRVGSIDGEFIRDRTGSKLLQIDGNRFLDKTGSCIAEIQRDDVRDRRGNRLICISDIDKEVECLSRSKKIAVWLAFLR